jgi:psp operon transcriptional activator
VRELKNVVERAVYSMTVQNEPIPSIVFDPFYSPWRPREKVREPTAERSTASPEVPYDFKEHIQKMEVGLLLSALKQCRHNQKKTAEFLGITYHQLRGYLRKYELTDSDEPEVD